MAPPESDTHEIAFLEQDNGELQEDVVAKEGPRSHDERSRGNAVDEEVAGSFPASDPPSHWSGGGAGGAGRQPDEDRAPEHRVVGRAPVEDVPERDHPADPVPGTLPPTSGAITAGDGN